MFNLDSPIIEGKSLIE